MRKVELLSPVGDFECLKAAVQNGANSVYLGASSFSARAKATNFDAEELLEAIKYAKLKHSEPVPNSRAFIFVLREIRKAFYENIQKKIKMEDLS